MVADPLLLKAGSWLAIAGGVLLVLTVLAFVMGWGVRFRLVGVSSFTLLLAAGCGAFAISYSPRSSIEGALVVPVVFDNGSNLVVAAAGADFPLEAAGPSAEQVASEVAVQQAPLVVWGLPSTVGRGRVGYASLEAEGVQKPVYLKVVEVLRV